MNYGSPGALDEGSQHIITKPESAAYSVGVILQLASLLKRRRSTSYLHTFATSSE